MEKTFVNVLAYSRTLKAFMIGILVFAVFSDAIVISLVVKVIDQATPDERTKIIGLLAVLLSSTCLGFPLLYLLHQSLRKHWIRTDEQGITYNFWGRNISASWEQVNNVSIVSRGRHGQALRTKGLRIDTKNGIIYALPILVDKSSPIPQLTMGITSRNLRYPDGRIRKIGVETSDIYLELQNYIPELLKDSSSGSES